MPAGSLPPDRSARREDRRPSVLRMPRCPEKVRGYDMAQVDAFLAAVDEALAGALPGPAERTVGSAEVRSAVFSGVRGGYRPEAVDEMLDAAEDALAAAERERFLRAHGPAAWQQRADELAALLRGRLDRPRTERFRCPSRPRAQGYSAAHVDVLCERLAARLEGTGALAAAELRRAVFPPAQGERSYEEQQVDAFLDRAVQLLLTLP